MTGLSALNLPQPLVWILAFAIIFGLLAAFAHLMKRIAGGRAAELEGGRNRVPRLGLVDSFDLDRHRKLLIVRRDNVEHLILVGPTDVVVESNIVRAASAAPLREDRAAIVQAPVNVSAPLSAPMAQPTTPPAPPIPATPQMMQAPAPAAPTMPMAPFPIPQPTRPAEARKSTMPPPPPFGAPKRGSTTPPQRIEPVLTAIAGGAPPVDKQPAATEKPVAASPAPAPMAEPVREPAKAEARATEAPQAEPPKAEEKPVFAPAPMANTKPEPAAKPELETKAEPVAKPEPIAKPISEDPLLADLSAKLQDVLKANIKPSVEPPLSPARTIPPSKDDAAEALRAPLPPLPNLPPLPPKAEMAPPPSALPSEPKPEPTPAPLAAAPAASQVPPPAAAPPPVDAFEEELRRILGRTPQKG